MTTRTYRLHRLAEHYENAALDSLRHPAGTPQARAGIHLALLHLQLAHSYHQAANQQEQDKK